MKIMPVIMCGGRGTRLWPLSRESLPKQFIPLFSSRSSFQDIASILAQDTLFSDLVVLTNREYRFLVVEQLDELGIQAEIVLEPVRRDSAAAVAVACELANKHGPETIVSILAADHTLQNPAAFSAILRQAGDIAAAGNIVTLGVVPDRAATGYGYIRKGEALPNKTGGFRVEQFIEKPDIETASEYVTAGYLWNSGNFIFPASLMLSELRDHEPAIASAAHEGVALASRDLQFLLLDEASFSSAPQKSIDYAVMEHTKHAAVIPADIGWSDVGTWSSVREIVGTDESGNTVIGDGFTDNCENVFVHSPACLTACIGLKDVIIVTTPDAVLAVDRTHTAEVKDLVATFKSNNRKEVSVHRRVLRPWGYYQSVDEAPRHQVKRIVVKPGGRLSLQKHYHRAEHWIVVKGTAEVTLDNHIKLVHENESIYVPIGTVHRLANPGKIELHLIEVQTGSYLGEDDIIRVEDIYNR